MAPAQQYHDHVKRVRLVPEFDGYIPYVGDTAEGELKEPTEDQLVASFNANAKNGKLGGRELDTYLKGVNGVRVLCKIYEVLGFRSASTLSSSSPRLRTIRTRTKNGS